MLSFSFTKRKNYLLYSIQLCLAPGTSARALETTNYAEIATTIASVATEIAANHSTFKNNTNNASIFRCITEALSLINKGFFFYNHFEATSGTTQPWSFNEPFDRIFEDRDCIGQGILATLDAAKLASHLAAFVKKETPDQLGNDNADLTLENYLQTSFAEAAASSQTIEEKHQKSKLQYFTNVILLPTLKGITATAIACTQEYATAYSRGSARFTATAAHFFVRLLQEYNNLNQDSQLTKPLQVALLSNALWVLYETQELILDYPNYKTVPLRKQRGACTVCLSDNIDLQVLGCNHRFCPACLKNTVEHCYKNDRINIHMLNCPDDGCQHTLTRNEIKCIMNDSAATQKIFRAIDDTLPERRKKAVITGEFALLSREELKKMNLAKCPYCNFVMQKLSGCDHARCGTSDPYGTRMDNVAPGACGRRFCFGCGQKGDHGFSCNQ